MTNNTPVNASTVEELREKFRTFMKATFSENGSRSITYDETFDWFLTHASTSDSTLREKEELAESLLDMYYQYCYDGHSFMSAGEGASFVLKKQGYADFDHIGRIITKRLEK